MKVPRQQEGFLREGSELSLERALERALHLGLQPGAQGLSLVFPPPRHGMWARSSSLCLTFPRGGLS